MKSVFDRQGKTIAWLNNNHVYDLKGRQVLAFISNGSVFTYRGRHLGWFSNGFFRDNRGNAVAFVHDASHGPLPPITQIPPIPPIPVIPPLPPIPHIPPIPPIDSLNWSNLNWENFINQ